MSLTAKIRSLDGKTIADVMNETAHAVDNSRAEGVRAMQASAVDTLRTTGVRFHIHTRKNVAVPLTARAGRRTPTRAYALTVPLGFWSIIELGSSDKPVGWDIVSRKEGAKGRTRKVARRARKGAVFFGVSTVGFKTGAFLGAKPLRTPYGPRFHVHHPHLRTIGHPFEEAEVIGERRLPEVYDTALVASVAKVWR